MKKMPATAEINDASQISKKLLESIKKRAEKLSDRLKRPVRFMEVCGTHTVAISRSGLRDFLKDYMVLASGPGCPVCVTDYYDIDTAIALCRANDKVTVATFGDMVRVPGSNSSLEKEKARGASIKIFYSPQLAVEFAAKNPDREVVFLAVGFETTMPAIALALEQALSEGIKNFSILSLGKLVPPAIRALLEEPDFSMDGLILPGHVSAVIGRRDQEYIAVRYHIPAAITGFEELDLLTGISTLLMQVEQGQARVENCYRRVVREEGNPRARAIIEKFFEPVDVSWRGLGVIPGSGLALKKDFQEFDARIRFPVEVQDPITPRGCRCGDLLKGKALPVDCGLFGKACTPVTPVGPCMVSSEGACAAWYNYGDNVR